MNLTANSIRTSIALCIILLSSAYNTFSQEFEVILYEGFENGGNRPAGWSEQFVSGSRIWRYENGGYAPTGAPTFRHPPNAYSGNYNALFQDESIGPKRRLITPAIDLRTAIKPTLVFWHAQDQWDESTDELKVYYSITKNPYTWVQLEHYTVPTANWTKREIILPDAVKVQECFIAFEGISNWGWGVCIDEFKLEERGLLARTVESFSLKQLNVIFPSGAKINPLANIRAFVSGNNGEIPINSIKLDYTGTNINDISNIRIYHTRDSLFSITTPIASNVTNNGNEITITAPTFNLFTGDNYIWICVDIESVANYGNKVDFTLGANSVQLGNSTFPTTALNPTQFATIHKSILLDDFTNVNGWARTSLWQIGVPTGQGSFDPNYAYFGTNVLATNLSGNYPSSITPDNPHSAISSSVNAKYYQNLTVFYKRWLNIEYFDKTSVQVSNDGETNWIKLFESNSDILDRRWRTVSHNIAPFATRKENVKIKFSIDTTNQVTEYGGWNIDNFAITGEFIHSDVGVKAKLQPIQKCGLTSTETVTVRIKNYGGATVNVPFEVGYSLNGGASYTKEWFNDPINSEQEVEFTFTTPANLSSPGLKNMVFRTYLTGDQDASNNSYSENLYVFPTVTFPYQTSFETSTSFWYPSGINSSWQWGTPSGVFINKASNGTRAWVTNLSQNYKNNEYSYLESPCFDLTTAEYPIISFDYLMQVEEGTDGMLIQYSIDGGLSWTTLPKNENYSSNWYDTETITALGSGGWSINKSSYVTAKTLLPTDAIGISGVKFRFLFASNPSQTFEGVAIDMIRVYELPYDLGITSLNSPTTACEIGNNVTLGLTLTNFGYRPLPIDYVVPIKIQVDNETIKSETITYNGVEPLAKNSTFDFTTVNTFNLYSAGTHDIIAHTNLTIDDNQLNDTLYTSVEVTGMPGYSLGPDIGTMDPEGLIIDAGQGYKSYEWYKYIDPDWVLVVDSTSYRFTLTDDGWGSYAVVVENDVDCTATDTIVIAQSDKNIGVTNILNIVSDCTNPSELYPEVNLKFFGLVEYDGIKTFPIKLAINGQVIIEEVVTPNENWGVVDRTDSTYVFSTPIDISEIGSYQIAIYTDLYNDLNRLNDTTKITINTWGEPMLETFVQVKPSVFEVVASDIVSTSADSLVFKATSGFISYNWEQQLLGQTSWTTFGNDETFYLSTVPNNLVSAYYRVTAVADHGCGVDIDTVFVNAADLAISSIVSPIALTCETSEPTPLKIIIKNVGYQIYPIGTEIYATVVTPFGDQTKTITLVQELTHNQEYTYQFPELVQFPIGEHYVSFSIENNNDPNTNNNSKGLLSTVNPTPWVTLEPDSLFKIFGPDESYTISPSYSEDVVSYQWHDGSEDPDYLIWGPPLYINYNVVAKNSYECSASESLIVISSDLAISGIVSPKNDCVLADDTPVSFTLFNNGNRTYPIGTGIEVSLFLDGNFVVTENINLPVNLASKSSTNINLAHKLDLAGRNSATVHIEIASEIIEVFYDNNSQNKTVYALGYPTITLGANREVHAYEEILDPGYYELYSWQDASTNRTFTATEDGTYSVTVTDFTGCEAYAEVTLTFFVDDIGVTQIIEPFNGCNKTSTEPVSIVIKNLGTYAFPSGTSINAGFSYDGNSYSEEIILDQLFSPNDELPFTFTDKANLSQAKDYTITVWVEVNNDMVESNNSISKVVTSHPKPNVSFNLSNPYYTSVPFTLYAGTDYVSYLWQDESTENSFHVTEPGTYHVTVIDANGCDGYTEIEVIFMRSGINISEILSPATQQCFVSPMPIKVKVKNERDNTLPAGSQLFMNYTLGSGTPVEESLVLGNDLAVGEFLEYTFTKTENLAQQSYNFMFKVDYLDMDGNEYSHSTTINPNPSVELGPASLLVTFPHTLNAVVLGASNYLWSTGSTSPTTTVYETDKYWLRVTNTFGCPATDTIYVYDATWVDEIPGIGAVVSVFPNPVKDWLTVKVETEKPGEFTFELFSPLGQKVYQQKQRAIQTFNNDINVSSYSPGVYLLRISAEGKWVTVRVIIQ